MTRSWSGLALGVLLAAVLIGCVPGANSTAQNGACLPTAAPSEHHLWGRPEGAGESSVLVVHHDYELVHNAPTKFANWVAYRLDGSTLDGPDRSRNYRLDPCLNPGDQVSDRGFAGANSRRGYDRGHLAPLATFEDSDYWAEVNFMSNIAPQHQTLNRGVWRSLEARIRGLVSPDDPVYVLTGLVYEESMPELPNAGVEHQVPSDYWKIVAVGDPDVPSSFAATAFWFDQYGCVVRDSCRFDRSSFLANRVRVDRIESATGFDVFAQLPDEREATVESGVGTWPPGSSDEATPNVVITKVLADAEGDEPAGEWIEVCNQESDPVEISGWTVSDEEGTYEYPDGTELERLATYGSCLRVSGAEYNPSGDTNGLMLANSGETLILRDEHGKRVHECSYGEATEGGAIVCDG